MGLQILALACLIGAIALGFIRKTNVGFVCLGLALILGTIGGMSSGDIYKGFPYKLFATLLGTMLFFSLLQENGTLNQVSHAMTRLCGKKTFLVPVIIYLISFLLSAAGPGAISVQTVMVLFAVPLGVHMGVNPVLMGIMAVLGAVGGTASPIALTGIIVSDLMAEMDMSIQPSQVFLGVSVANFLCAAAMYLVFRGWKPCEKKGAAADESQRIQFTANQKISLAAMLVMVVSVVGFSQDIGLVCFTLSLVLILLRAGDEKKAMKMIPWSTLILICGVSVLMNITQILGGIELLSDILASFMTRRTERSRQSRSSPPCRRTSSGTAGPAPSTFHRTVGHSIYPTENLTA